MSNILSRISKPLVDALKPEIKAEQIQSSKLGDVNAALEAAWLKASENIEDEAARQIVLQKIGEALVYVANEIKIVQLKKLRDKIGAK
jgi:hypothetical protein